MEWKGEVCAINQSLKSLAAVHTEPETNNYRRRVGSPGSPEEELKDGARLRNCSLLFFLTYTVYVLYTSPILGWIPQKQIWRINKQTFPTPNSWWSTQSYFQPHESKPTARETLGRRQQVVSSPTGSAPWCSERFSSCSMASVMTQMFCVAVNGTVYMLTSAGCSCSLEKPRTSWKSSRQLHDPANTRSTAQYSRVEYCEYTKSAPSE